MLGTVLNDRAWRPKSAQSAIARAIPDKWVLAACDVQVYGTPRTIHPVEDARCQRVWGRHCWQACSQHWWRAFRRADR